MDNDFDLDEYEKIVEEAPLSYRRVYQDARRYSEFNIIGLYDSIENCLFKDVNYEKVVSMMPKWVADEEIRPEGCFKRISTTLRRKSNSVTTIIQQWLHALMRRVCFFGYFPLRELPLLLPATEFFS